MEPSVSVEGASRKIVVCNLPGGLPGGLRYGARCGLFGSFVNVNDVLCIHRNINERRK